MPGAIEDFDTLWKHVLQAQCKELRERGQTWEFDAASNQLAVIIEPRTNHPFLEPVVRNVMDALGSSWNLMIITHEVSKIDGMFPGCVTLKRPIPLSNLSEEQYSSFLMSESFWEPLPAEHVLIFQTDVVMFRPLRMDFLKYDFAGANVFVRQYISPRVGAMNGGFSVRKKSAMIECIRSIRVERVCAALGAPSNALIPEDIYFTHACEMLGLSMPPINLRKELSIEAEYYSTPCAFHGFQHSFYYFSLSDCLKLIEFSPSLGKHLTAFASILPPNKWVFEPSDLAIVIARHEENLEWILEKKYGPANVIIYNKGKREITDCVSKDYVIVSLPNVGREAHTYLTYILQHYDRLPAVVHFTQGGIDDHGDRMQCELFNFTGMYSENTTYAYFTEGLSADARIGNYLGSDVSPSEVNGITWFSRYVNPHINLAEEKIHMWYAGIFSVKREMILKRPRSYYEMLYGQLQYDVNPEVGHFIERSWFYIFGQKSY